ncbi:hypothetical Protein YC6258_03249 [Gynuella sunshinyii YC6258]|uniref:Uncharacterized protein n=2 Tax=Gynuella sunshinyii TaxID=1445505 RepID=A0A0C5V7A6_9GAMM|nr:hypothetical Protein YC6258_03249 [Gynuella sunshinyii YC6258]
MYGCYKAKNALYLFCLLILCVVFFPRVIVSELPYSVSGLDFSIPLIVASLIFFGRAKLLFSALRFIEFKIYAFIVVLMLFFPFLSFLFSDSEPAFVRSLLQGIRHLSSIFIIAFLIFFYVYVLNNNLEKFIRIIFYFYVYGSLFYLIVSLNTIPALSPSSDLDGTTFSSIGMDLRFAGFSGSPTPFAVICFLYVWFIWSCEYIQKSFLFRGVATIAMVFLILLSLSKSAIVLTIFMLFLMLLISSYRRNRGKFWFRAPIYFCVFFSCMVFMFIVFKEQFLDLYDRAIISFYGRLDIYDRVIEQRLLAEDFMMIIGSGWKSYAVGAHNEVLEILIGFGLFAGLVIILLLYVVLPSVFLIYVRNINALIPIFFIFVSSLFQEIFLDPVVMIFFVTFLIIYRMNISNISCA